MLSRRPTRPRGKAFGTMGFLLAAGLLLSDCGGKAIHRAAVENTAPHPATEPAAPAHPLPDTGALIGMTGGALKSMFGEPDLKRRDPPAELWQYRDDRCALNLYLYPPRSNLGPHTVNHFHVTSPNGRKITVADCLYSLTTGVDPFTKPFYQSRF